jgi:transposase
MKRIRFTEEQIIGVLREAEAGTKTADLARKHGVSEATLYNWKAKYGGLEVSEAKRLRAWRTRTDASSGCWRTRCWTTQAWRACRQKNGNACRQAGSGRASSGLV